MPWKVTPKKRADGSLHRVRAPGAGGAVIGEAGIEIHAMDPHWTRREMAGEVTIVDLAAPAPGAAAPPAAAANHPNQE